MKQKLLELTKLRRLLLLAMITLLGSAGAWAEEVVYKTALFGTGYNPKNFSYTGSFEATNNGFAVTVMAFNNNNNGWNGQIKCGRKNYASTGIITTKESIDKAISSVAITIDAITADKVNSIKLFTSSNNSSWTEIGSFSKETGLQSVTLPSPTENLYYQIEFDCASGSANGFVTISKVEYLYDNSGGSSLTACDLALTGAPIELEFDLYNNATAQTIHYTTSSTGEVSVEAGQYDVSCYVDNDAKTISVTPFAVTNGPQTVTVNQAADDTYKAGSVTFTVTVTDSTPIPTHNATFSVNGTTSTEEFEEGADITFPADPADTDGKTFVGWVADAISGVTDEAPTFVTSATMGTSDVTYYAVFATIEGDSESKSIEITSSTEGVPTSYGTAKTFSECTFGGVKFQVMQMYNNNKLQWRAAGNNNGTGTMYNSESLNKIESIVLTYNEGDSNHNFSLKIGDSANPTGGTSITPSTNGMVCTFDCSSYDYDFFVLTNGSGAGYLDKLVINYSIGSSTISGYCTNVVADTRQDSELAFSDSEANASIGTAFTAPTLNTAEGFNGTVEYSSSDETVAQVMDIETGELRIVGGGTTVITATFAGNDDFKAGSASYTLTVTDNRIATTMAFAQPTVTIDVNDIASFTGQLPTVKNIDGADVEYEISDMLSDVYFETDPEFDSQNIISDMDNNSGEFNLSGNLGTVTIIAHYRGSDTYKPCEASYTITVESVLENIAAFKAIDNDATATFRLTNAQVLYCTSNRLFIRDASGALLIYNSGLSYQANQILNGKLTAQKTTYRGQVETTGTIDGSNIVATDGGTAADPVAVTVEEATSNYATHDADLVQFSAANISSGLLTDGTVGSVTVYQNNFGTSFEFDANKEYDVVGILGIYNSTVQVYPISVTEVAAPVVPNITLSSTAIEAPTAGADGTLPVTYNNITNVAAEVYFCDADGNSATYDWIDAEINDNNNVEYVIDANTGEARTAYFKVYALDDDENDIYSELVTVSQAAYVAPVEKATYALYTGALVEGDYLIVYNGYAMNTTVENNRLQYAEVTPQNDEISTDNASIVWHIAPSGDNWTIYNADADAYAAGTGVKNKAQMLADGTDEMALWTVSGTETYDFVNVANAATNVNAYLRNNGTYGFACYAEGTGGALSLYKKVDYSRTIAAIGNWGTICLPNAASISGAQLYTINGVDNKENPTTFYLDEVTGMTEAGKAYIFKATATTIYASYSGDAVTEAVAAADNSGLAGNITNVAFAITDAQGAPTTTGENPYVIKDGQVCKAGTNVKCGAYKGYIDLNEVPTANTGSVKLFIDGFDGIEGIENGIVGKDSVVYDLAGRRVARPIRGIYIVNGKKVLVK